MKFLNQKIFYKLHTYLSLLFFIPLAVVCFSGAILVYKDELNSFLAPNVVNVNLNKENLNKRISFDELRDIIASELGGYEMVGINIDANPKKCDKIWLIEHNDSQKEWKFIYFDAFSGKIKSEPLAHDEGFFGVLTELHESLFLEKSGHVILTLTAIFTFFICISGFVIYRKFWLTLLKLRVNRLNVFMSDIHKMIGIFSTPILLLICISGVWWEFQMARMPEFKNDFVIDAKIYNKSLSLDELVAHSKNDLAGFEPHFISLPFMQGANIRLFGYVKDQNFLHNEYSSILTYDKDNGELVSILDIKNANLSEEILSAFRKSHFGNYNQITKFIWFLVGISPLILSISGLYLWIKRNFKRRKNEKILISLVALNLMQPQIFASQSDKILEAIDVVESERRDDANYFAKELVKSTTRLNLTSRQTPQSLTVLTEARLKDQGIKDYQVLLRNTPGITLNKMDERVYPTARGFEIDYCLLDSMPSLGSFSLATNDMSLLPYERVEVVKGANGLLAGAGNPAASLNFIRKRADLKELKGNFGVSAGSYDRYGVNGDVQTPVNESGSVRARLSFMHEKSHSYMDYYNRKNSAIYGVVDSDIGDSSWLSLGAFYQELKRHGVRWGGMPAFYTDGSRTNFSKNEIFSQPWTRWDIKTLDFYADFKHYFENEASLNLSYSFRRANTDSNLLYYGGAVNLDGTGNINDLSVYANKREENIHNVDAYANIPYELANLSHEFVFGAMYNNYKKSSDKVSSYWLQKTTPAGLAYTARSRIDFKNLHLDDPKFPYEDQNNKDKTIQKAFYASNKFSLTDELKLLLGARVSYYKYEIEGGKDNRNFTNEITPYLGVTYDITANHTLYASYTSIFKPQNVKGANDKYLDPIQGKDYEVGIKGEYFDGALQASLGVFKIVQDKLGIDTGKINPATNAYIYESSKGVTSKGVELDLNGEIAKGLSLSFGATHFNAKDAKGEKYATDSSRSTANLFAKYEIRDFRVGAGAMYKSKIYTGKGAREITQKGYTLANLMLGYKFAKNFDVQLNIDNLFNKKYYEGIGPTKMVYGDPRTFNLSFNYKF